MKYILMILLFAGALFSYENEVKINGDYSSTFKNQFKPLLETKTKTAQITEIDNKNIIIKTSSNKKDFLTSLNIKQETFHVKSNSCNTLLNIVLSENYKIESNADFKVACSIKSASLDFNYHKETLNSINLDLKVNLLIHNKIRVLTAHIDDQLDKVGDNYNYRILSHVKHLSTEEKIKQMFEILILRTLKKQGL